MSDEKVVANIPLEAFFDLVYTLAFAQVTTFVMEHLDAGGVLEGLALLMALWWSWVCYSWLTDGVEAEDMIKGRLIIMAATVMIAVVSLGLREPFGSTALLFAVSYFIVRLLHYVLFILTAEEKPEPRRSNARLARDFLSAPALIVIASLVPGVLRAVLWIAALLVDYFTPLIRDARELEIDPVHFATRYSLLIVLALGVSITGIGETHPEITPQVVMVGALALVITVALWWTYFDYVKDAAQKKLEEVPEEERAKLVHDAYSYVHLLMLIGIIAIALGIKHTLEDAEHPLTLIPAGALCGGVALYLLGLNMFRLRMTGTVRIARFVVAALACVTILIAVEVPALISVSFMAILVVVLVIYETLRPDKFRQEVKPDVV